METDGTGAGFGLRECVPLFLSYTKTIDFFPFSARSRGISRFSVRRMVTTPGPGSVRSLAEVR